MPIVLLGAGAGAAVVPLNLIVLSRTAPEEVDITSAVLQAALAVGGSLGLAVLLTLFARAQGVADGVVAAFRGAVVIAAVAALIGLLVWFGPGRTTSRGGSRPTRSR